MPPKNPFVNCKSRKRRYKTLAIKKEPQGYCPRTMIRYDDVPKLKRTVWVCRICTKCLLSEDAVRSHQSTCNLKALKPKKEPAQSSHFKIETDIPRYICQHCNKDFSRKVSLKKHEEIHDRAPIEVDDDEWDSDE